MTRHTKRHRGGTRAAPSRREYQRGADGLADEIRRVRMLMHVDDRVRTPSSAPTASPAPAYTLTYLFASVKAARWLDPRINVDNGAFRITGVPARTPTPSGSGTSHTGG